MVLTLFLNQIEFMTNLNELLCFVIKKKENLKGRIKKHNFDLNFAIKMNDINRKK